MGIGGGGGSQSAGYQIGSYWSPGGLPSGFKSPVVNINALANGAFQDVGYTVTAGKTFTLTSLQTTNPMSQVSGATQITFGYSDDGAGTNFVSLISVPVFYAPTPAQSVNLTVVMQVPATKHLTVKNNGGQTLYAGTCALFLGFEA